MLGRLEHMPAQILMRPSSICHVQSGTCERMFGVHFLNTWMPETPARADAQMQLSSRTPGLSCFDAKNLDSICLSGMTGMSHLGHHPDKASP